MHYISREILILYFITLLGVNAELTKNFNLKEHLLTFSNLRYPLEPYYNAWIEVRSYIEKSLSSYGLLVETKKFRTKIATFENSLKEVEGENIIGESVSPITDAPVILVASYYDNTLTRNPLHENGASLASLMEVARTFQGMKRNEMFYQNVSVIFTALDLNVKNYVPLGPGKQGSSFFVREWLPEKLRGRKFLGAVVLDSISSFSSESHSQDVIEDLSSAFPENYNNMEETEFRANFLATLSRGDDSNQKLTEGLENAYRKANPGSKYRLESFTVKDGVKIPTQILDKVRRNPQIDFWTNSPPFPAILLTDIASTRKSFDERSCSTDCSLDTFWGEERKSFVEQATSALLEMLLSYQKPNEGYEPSAVPGGENGGPSPFVSLSDRWHSVLLVMTLVALNPILM